MLSFSGPVDNEGFFKGIAEALRRPDTVDIRIGDQVHRDYALNPALKEDAISGACDFMNTKTAMLRVCFARKEREILDVKINDVVLHGDLFEKAVISVARIELKFSAGEDREGYFEKVGSDIRSCGDACSIEIGANHFDGYRLNSGNVLGRCDFVNKKKAELHVPFVR